MISSTEGPAKVYVLKRHCPTWKFLARNLGDDGFRVVLSALQAIAAYHDNPFVIMHVPASVTLDSHAFSVQADSVNDWTIVDLNTFSREAAE